ncbi:MAG: hypothetical protein CMF62_04145 [Magnetococcales bacterium]|nr:hypothetical protein [Magnetococcales bacterium]
MAAADISIQLEIPKNLYLIGINGDKTFDIKPNSKDIHSDNACGTINENINCKVDDDLKTILINMKKLSRCLRYRKLDQLYFYKKLIDYNYDFEQRKENLKSFETHMSKINEDDKNLLYCLHILRIKGFDLSDDDSVKDDFTIIDLLRDEHLSNKLTKIEYYKNFFYVKTFENKYLRFTGGSSVEQIIDYIKINEKPQNDHIYLINLHNNKLSNEAKIYNSTILKVRYDKILVKFKNTKVYYDLGITNESLISSILEQIDSHKNVKIYQNNKNLINIRKDKIHNYPYTIYVKKYDKLIDSNNAPSSRFTDTFVSKFNPDSGDRSKIYISRINPFPRRNPFPQQREDIARKGEITGSSWRGGKDYKYLYKKYKNKLNNLKNN